MTATILRYPGHRYLPSSVGLAACQTCCGGEASLPTHCPMEPMTEAQQDAVAEGRLDYTVSRGWHLTEMEDAS